MTIAALLSAHGVRASRYITADGRTVFDNVTATTTGYTHADYGNVTKVQPHTFHGGEAPTDTSTDQWWDAPGALAPHIQAMESAFPAFTHHAPDPEHAPCWIGTIDTGRGKFRVAVVLRYDRRLPIVSVLDRKRLGKQRGRFFTRSPHLYDNGAPCIADQNDWNPDLHTAATATAWLAHWLAAYTEWLIANKWPVEGDASAA